MEKSPKTWTPDAIGSLAIVLGCLLLIGLGLDGEVKSILALAVGWLFGGSYRAAHPTNKTKNEGGER